MTKKHRKVALVGGVLAVMLVLGFLMSGIGDTASVAETDSNGQAAASRDSLINERDSLIKKLRAILGSSADVALNRILGNTDNDGASDDDDADDANDDSDDAGGESDSDSDSGGSDDSDTDGDSDGDEGGSDEGDMITVGNVTITNGVEYGRGKTKSGSTALLMDIYEPAASCIRPRPVVILIHGGGFQNGSRQTFAYRKASEYLAERGYIAASIDYRMTGDNPVPSDKYESVLRAEDPTAPQALVDVVASALEDTVAAIDYFNENADEYCANPKRMALWGDSAGSILALTAAYSMDDLKLGRQGVDVVVNHWGSMEKESHMENGEADIITIHGTADPAAAYTEAIEIHEQADKVNIANKLYGIPGAGHGYDSINIFSTKVEGKALIDHIVSFLVKYL